ncbi:type II toxin-antitoxin system VapC family toxin [Neomoorella humiferrea]|uniref:Ribonuclease VapC n=1 Tax=Neomoorella humiferrea TaxID=676965 RepID=A0A2T0AR98_9FIRM|nr:type II toxin-antitoxin system VapC family toxin [Moorella humiferrea]PRR71898.1 Ribonuclease VapC19 [Moorella humiferrea]
MKNKTPVKGFLLDTTALIDFLRGDKHTIALLEVLKDKAPLAACPITVAEVFSGAREKELLVVERFLSSLKFYPIDYESSRLAGRWRYTYARKGITLSLPDTLIAAVALRNNLALVTANDRHYPMEELIIITH